MKTANRLAGETEWVLLFSALPVLGFAYVWNRYAVNIPFWDDLFVVENSLIPLQNSQSLGEKLRLWFGWYTQTEHRIIYNRLIFWLIYQAESLVNYRTAMVIGNLSLVGMAVYFFQLFQKLAFPARYFLPVPFLLFGLASYANQFWGMGALSNFTVILFVLGSLSFLVRKTPVSFGLAVLSALAATLTLGSGLLVWPVGLLLLFFQRRYSALLGWASLTAVTILFYTRGYVRPDWAPNPLQNAVNPVNILQTFAGFAGATFDILQPRQATFTGYELFGIEYHFSWLPVFLGSILIAFIAFRIFIQYVKSAFLGLKGPFRIPPFPPAALNLIGLLVFVLVTALAASVSRAGGDLSAVLNSKYKIYSILLTLGGYALWLMWMEGRAREWSFRLFMAFAVLWHVAGYTQYLPNVLNNRQALLADAMNFQQNGSWRFYPAGVVTRLANHHTTRIAEAGFYQLPTGPDLLPPDSTGQSLRRVELMEHPDYVLVAENTLPVPADPRQGRFLLLSRNSQRFFFPTTPRLTVWSQAILGQPFTSGFLSRIYTVNVPEGRYRLGLYDPATHTATPLDSYLTVRHD